MRARHLAVALVTAAALAAAPSVLAQDKKKVSIKEASKLEKQIATLMGDVDLSDTAEVERVFVQIDQILAKQKNEALKHPFFWRDCIQSTRLRGKQFKDELEKNKQVSSKEITEEYAEGKTFKATLWFHGGTTYKITESYPLMLTLLPKGADAKAFVEKQIEPLPAAEEGGDPDDRVKKGWIVAAVAESADFPLTQTPVVGAYLLMKLRNMFNIDVDRWFVQGVDGACIPAQRLACESVPDRVAGLVLRNPTGASGNVNCTMFDGLIVHKAPPEGKANAVVEAYEALAPGAFPGVVDGPDADRAVVDFVSNHPGRKTLSEYAFQTLIDEDNIGETWRGTLYVSSPGKRGELTSGTVKYDSETNTVHLQAENLSEFWLYMNDDLLDLDKEVVIVANGEELVRKTFERNVREMFQGITTFGEFGRLFPCRFRGVIRAPIQATDEDGDKKDEDDDKKGDDKKGE